MDSRKGEPVTHSAVESFGSEPLPGQQSHPYSGISYYRRDSTFLTDDAVKGAIWMDEQQKKNIFFRRVDETFIGVYRVSTVFLSLDHSWFDSARPLIFETMVFDVRGYPAVAEDEGIDVDTCRRWSLEIEAVVGHALIVGKLRTGRELPPGASYHGHSIAQDGGGFVLRVTNAAGIVVLDLHVPWETYRPASAGHRLIECGYAVLPAAHVDPRRTAGWEPTEYGWSAPVYRMERDDPSDHDDTCEQLADDAAPCTCGMPDPEG